MPDGVYYYLCTVIFARLDGDEPVQLNGYVHLLGSGGQGKDELMFTGIVEEVGEVLALRTMGPTGTWSSARG